MRKHVFARVVLLVTLGFLLLLSGCLVIINEEAEPKACKRSQDEASAQQCLDLQTQSTVGLADGLNE